MAKPTEPAGDESAPTLYDVVRINGDNSRHVVAAGLHRDAALRIIWGLFKTNPDRDYVTLNSK